MWGVAVRLELGSYPEVDLIAWIRGPDVAMKFNEGVQVGIGIERDIVRVRRFLIGNPVPHRLGQLGADNGDRPAVREVPVTNIQRLDDVVDGHRVRYAKGLAAQSQQLLDQLVPLCVLSPCQFPGIKHPGFLAGHRARRGEEGGVGLKPWDRRDLRVGQGLPGRYEWNAYRPIRAHRPRPLRRGNLEIPPAILSHPTTSSS